MDFSRSAVVLALVRADDRRRRICGLCAAHLPADPAAVRLADGPGGRLPDGTLATGRPAWRRRAVRYAAPGALSGRRSGRRGRPVLAAHDHAGPRRISRGHGLSRPAGGFGDTAGADSPAVVALARWREGLAATRRRVGRAGRGVHRAADAVHRRDRHDHAQEGLARPALASGIGAGRRRAGGRWNATCGMGARRRIRSSRERRRRAVPFRSAACRRHAGTLARPAETARSLGAIGPLRDLNARAAGPAVAARASRAARLERVRRPADPAADPGGRAAGRQLRRIQLSLFADPGGLQHPLGGCCAERRGGAGRGASTCSVR